MMQYASISAVYRHCTVSFLVFGAHGKTVRPSFLTLETLWGKSRAIVYPMPFLELKSIRYSNVEKKI